MDEEEEYEDAKRRIVYDRGGHTWSYSKKRVSDLKGNSHVILPGKSKNFDQEANLEMLRTEMMACYREYWGKNCDERGRQKSNLTKEEERGLKSLKKRVKEGEIAVMQTDKSGRFAVIGVGEYLRAGGKHTAKDEEVGWEVIKSTQAELNGHMSMFIKFCRIGESWNHGKRVRETMINQSMSISPMYLTFKDHKGWDYREGTVPPTRPICGGNTGMNLHISEALSEVIEPMVEAFEGGNEIISGEDFMAQVEAHNEEFKNWNKWSWWEGKKTLDGEYVACSRCEISGGILTNDECQRNTEMGNEGTKPALSGTHSSQGNTSLMSEEALPAPAGNLRCTCKVEMKNVDKWEDFWDTEEGQDTSFWTKPLEKQIRKIRASQVRTIRRQEWERRVEYDVEDEDRSWNSKDVLEEDLQNFEVPQVIIGADVEALYPSLDTEECARIGKAETLRSKIRWNDLDYLEGARFIALNRTADWCRQSDLRRVLPVRRGKTGSRPGVRGKGPMGRGRGDQEQWMFPNITLTEEEKRKITAEVWRIVTEVMFKNHLYTFGGRTYRQRSGGPIGLRGTCAIARLIMCSWDRDWTTMMEERRVKLWRYMRYMDDARVFMPPIRRGWRWVGGELIFKKTWEKEDFREGTGELEVTRRVMHSSMQEVFHFLKFTTEVGEGEGGWLPTLDLKIRVEDSNQVSFSYYEKPTTTNVMVQRRSAMEENSKMQILSNDMVRRLANTDPRQDKVEHCRVVDMFTQKLLTSGYSQEQARKIILSGIRGWERKKIRAKNEGRGVYRTSRQSAAGRTRKKVLGKTTWFRKRKTDNKEEIGEVKKTGRKRTKKEIQKTQEERSLRTRTVLFVENTKEGGLARKLREVVEKIQYILGYRIKVVERSGTPLKLLFPLGGLGEENRCGREDCLPCGQEGQEGRTRCRKRCILYENICMICNPDILDKKAKINPPKDHPSVYVGESARSAKERTEEHWRGFKDKREDSHIFKHHILHHHGEGKPSFHMRVSGVFKSALTRQVAEAVRIRRWGEGVVLNSKSEFNRCQLGRLTLGEEKSSNSTIIKDTPPNTNYNPILTDQREEESDREIEEWKKKKTADRRMMEIKDNIDLGRGLPMSPSTKRIRVDNLESDGKKGRKLKYPVISKDWGEQSEGAEDRNKDDKGNKDDCKEQRPQRRSRTGTRNGVERSVDPTESVHHPCEVENNEGHLPCNQEETPSPTLLAKEGEVNRSTVLDSGSPSRGQSCNMIHQLHSNKKQTTIECFLDSVKEKMTQPKELEITTRTPVRKVVKVPIVKESGRKRKKTSLPAPSIGSIKNYFTTGVKKTRNDDVVIGGGVSTNDTDTPTNDVVNTDVVLDGVRKTSLAPLNEQPAVNNDVKKTFTTIMRGGSSVKDTIKKHEALLENCVFGNGRCMTHYVKLERTVKQKKYSVINSIGKIDWKYRDVTCLVCPSQKGRGFVNLGNDKLPGAVGNMKGKTAD